MSLLELLAHVKVAPVKYCLRHFKSKISLWGGYKLAWDTIFQLLSPPALHNPQLIKLPMGWTCIFLGHGPQLFQYSEQQEQNT